VAGSCVKEEGGSGGLGGDDDRCCSSRATRGGVGVAQGGVAQWVVADRAMSAEAIESDQIWA
jgi:hypothetical protein